MTAVADPSRPDTSDMLAVHQVFRRALAAAPDLVGSATGPERIELVATFYANVLNFLEVHHHGEDLLVFPLLVERCPDDAATVSRVAGQHQDVTPALEGALGRIAPWANTGEAGRGNELLDALARLEEALVAHLDQEEAVVLPLCAANLSPEEWGRLPAHGLGNFGGDKIWLILGLIRENMTQEQRDQMLAHMPTPAVEMWTGMGNAAFDQFVAELRP